MRVNVCDLTGRLVKLIAAIIVRFATCWTAYKAISAAGDFWTDDRSWVEASCWIVGNFCCLVTLYGKTCLALLASLTRKLSVGLRRAAIFFEKWHLSWDKIFHADSSTREQQTELKFTADPIKESIFTSNRPTFPWPVAMTLAVAIAFAVAAFSIGPFRSNSSEITIAKQINLRPKSDRREIPATFADRYTLPLECMGCGGPEVDLVPLPKPRPMLKIPLPNPRPSGAHN